MIYKVFDPSDEKKINDFLEANREKIGKDSYWSEPKNGKLCFLFNDEFDPTFARRIFERSVWQKQHETICRALADIEVKINLWKQLPPDAKVGERELSGTIGGARGVENIDAKKGLELQAIDKANYEKQLEVLEELLSK